MKFNAYSVLLTTGLLMFATAVLSLTGSGVALLKAGAAAVDKDVSSFAVRAFPPLDEGALVIRENPVHPTRLAAIDDPE